MAIFAWFQNRQSLNSAERRIRAKLENDERTRHHQRRIDIREESLRKLSSEIAEMASKLDVLIRVTNMRFENPDMEEEFTKKYRVEIANKMPSDYLNDTFLKILFTLNDKEIFFKAYQLRVSYSQIYTMAAKAFVENGKPVPLDELDQLRIQVVELQDFICQKLETL